MKNSLYYKYFSVITLLLIISFIQGCATTKVATTPLIVPDYTFSPPSPVAPGSSGLKIAMLDPIFKGNFIYSNKSPFKQFRASMGKDFEQILTARGYILKGPYDAYDLMTYSDKSECQLGLEIEIDLNLVKTSGGWTYTPMTNYGYGITSGNYSTYEGTLNLSGKITISIIETFTQQKLLVKSVPVPQEDINVKAEANFPGNIMNSELIPIEDSGVHNPITNSLSSFYKSTMQLGWDMLSQEELQHVQNQVPGIRENAGFIKH
jgi:hypothetical protein